LGLGAFQAKTPTPKLACQKPQAVGKKRQDAPKVKEDPFTGGPGMLWKESVCLRKKRAVLERLNVERGFIEGGDSTGGDEYYLHTYKRKKTKIKKDRSGVTKVT